MKDFKWYSPPLASTSDRSGWIYIYIYIVGQNIRGHGQKKRVLHNVLFLGGRFLIGKESSVSYVNMILKESKSNAFVSPIPISPLNHITALHGLLLRRLKLPLTLKKPSTSCCSHQSFSFSPRSSRHSEHFLFHSRCIPQRRLYKRGVLKVIFFFFFLDHRGSLVFSW